MKRFSSPLPFRFLWLLAAMLAGLLARSTHPLTLFLTGLFFGLAQWAVLYHSPLRTRQSLRHLLWLPATTVSGMVAYLLIASLGVRYLGPPLIEYTAPYEDYFSHLIFLAILWTFIGLGQWPLLRGLLPNSKRWIVASAGGGAAGALIDLALLAAGLEIYTSLLAGMLAGGGYGVVTGPVIARLNKGDSSGARGKRE